MSKHVPLPSQFDGLGVSYAIKTGKSEYHAPCPKCGGTDRFVILDASRTTGGPFAFCRQCDHKWWQRGDDWEPLTDEERQEIARERARREKLERERIVKRRKRLAKKGLHLLFHENLDEFPRAVEIWQDKYGVNEWSLHYYRLGYCPEFTYYYKDQEHTSDTLTIPVFQPQTRYQIKNLRHRLLSPDKKGGKYRPHKAGLGQPVFIANLNRGVNGHVFVVEGEIKAMVVWQHIVSNVVNGVLADEGQWWMCANMQVVGLCGTHLRDGNESLFNDAKRVYIAMDIDVTTGGNRLDMQLATQIGADKCRLLSLPGKPDDLLVEGTMDLSDLRHFMRTGRKV